MTPYEQTLLECRRALRFIQRSGYLTIDNTIAIVHKTTLHLYARQPCAVDWILANLEAVKRNAYIICGADTIALFCYGEKVDDFLTRGIECTQADVTFATSPTMTIATLEPTALESAPLASPEPPLPSTPASVIKLFTINELSGFAQQVGFDPGAIASEIRAINPRAFHRNGEDLYELDAVYQAIDRLKDEAKERLKLVATQTRVMPQAQPPAAKKTVAKKKSTARKPTAKETVAAT